MGTNYYLKGYGREFNDSMDTQRKNKMGTNYYIKGLKDYNTTMDPMWHIGKRSAAGTFCFNCGITLCKGRVHYDDGYYDRCPICGESKKEEDLTESSAGIELGFNKNPLVIKTGVASASSFSLAMFFYDIIVRVKEEFGPDVSLSKKTIVNEYGDEFSYSEFCDLFNMIPSRLISTDMIGKEFC